MIIFTSYYLHINVNMCKNDQRTETKDDIKDHHNNINYAM